MEEAIKHQGKLVMIPYIDCSTISMVADYYGVSKSTIKNRYHSHKAELDKIGVMTIGSKEIEDLLPLAAVFKKTPDRCMVIYKFSDGLSVPLHVAKNMLFTKEAVDYIGTVLLPQSRDRAHKKDTENPVKPAKTSVAKKSTKFHSEEEKKLCINLAKAFASGDKLKLLAAAVDLDTYRMGQITELANSPELVKDSRTPWTSRGSFNRVVKTISEAINVDKVEIQNRVYYKMIHKYKLPLEERKIMPLIDAVRDSEWYCVYQAIVEICEEKLLDIRQVFKKSGINAAGLSVLVNFEERYNE